MTAVGCNASYPAAPTGPTQIARIDVQYGAPTSWLESSSATVRAWAIDVDGGWQDVTSQTSWVSSDPSVVTVSASHTATVTRVSAGTATIRAAYAGFIGELPVRTRMQRTYPLLALEWSGGWLSLEFPSTSQQLRLVHYQTASSSQTVTTLASWTSTDPGVVSVDGRGALTPLSPGTTTIAATYNGATETITASVPPPSR